MTENPRSVWGFATMDPDWGFAGYPTEIEAYRDRGDDRICGFVKEWVRSDVAYEQGKKMREDAVKEERERIAALLDALVAKAESEETYAGRQSYANCGATHGVGSYDLEELAKSLRGDP